MKSYLDLVSISARVHRRQNRMTLLCIIFAVFMVTAIFGTAEMAIRMEWNRLQDKHGSLSLTDLLGSDMGQTLLPPAVLLFFLILIAGVLMIAGSMNSSVTQRTQFFGMMRCIGMSRAQIVRFVRLEALHWCKTAVPVGLALGIAATWGLCWTLHNIVGEEFAEIPVFGISFVGVVSGILVGVVTVLFAAGAPAKRASKVSPVAAVSGNSDGRTNRRRMHTGCGKIEWKLGIHHAVSGKKNLFLMTGSFALSIILFLSFSVIIDLVDYVMPQQSAASDIDITGDGGNTIPVGLPVTLRGMDGVKEVYGRRSAFDAPAEFDADPAFSGVVDLVSFDAFDLWGLKRDGALKWGSDVAKVCGDSRYVLATSDPDSTWRIGDTVEIGGEMLTIAGLLENDPFSGDGLTGGKLTLITSGETYVRLTGETGYALVMLQLTGDATEENVQAIREAVGERYDFSDKRDERTRGTYLAFVSCVYVFLAVIALVAVLNIVNSISMSVSARIKQYGAMRAVGMDIRQVTRMIVAEAFTYAVCGCVAGCGIGLPLSHGMYEFLIAANFPYAVWHFPVRALGIIVLFVLLAAAVAVWIPAKRIRRMPVMEIIHTL